MSSSNSKKINRDFLDFGPPKVTHIGRLSEELGAMSLPVLIIVRFYCSPRLQIMPRAGEGDGEGSSQAMSISTQSSSPVSPSIPCFIPPHPQCDCYPGQRVIGISWQIPQHCSPFQAQGDMLMKGSTPLPLPPLFYGPRAAFVVHFLHYYFSPAPLFYVLLFMLALCFAFIIFKFN